MDELKLLSRGIQLSPPRRHPVHVKALLLCASLDIAAARKLGEIYGACSNCATFHFRIIWVAGTVDQLTTASDVRGPGGITSDMQRELATQPIDSTETYSHADWLQKDNTLRTRLF